jgi:CRISPR-associated endonuclease/helicase Cas3
LAWLGRVGNSNLQNNLIAYLIAAHHGKVRLSIRSLPKENQPEDNRLFARGIWDKDRLPPIVNILPNGAVIDLTPMQLGEGSWLERMVDLRNDSSLGPFRLAFLESILRIADWRASKKEEG